MGTTTAARLTRWIAAAELPIVLAIAPALFFPTLPRLAVLVVVPMVWLCARASGGRFVPSTPMNPALWLLLGMVVVSLAATLDVQFSLPKVAALVLGILLFWALARWLVTEARFKIAMVAFVLGGCGFALLGLLGTVHRANKIETLDRLIDQLPRFVLDMPGTDRGFHPAFVAGCLLLVVPLQAALISTGAHRWLYPSTRSRWVAGTLVGVQAVLLTLTAVGEVLMQSRAAWVGLLAAGAAFLAWHGRRSRITLAVLTTLVLVVAGSQQRAIRDAVAVRAPGLTEEVARRPEIWSRAVAGIEDFPLTGIGMDTFRKIMPVRYASAIAPPYQNIAHAHNILLQVGLDLGVPGLVAYLTILIVAAALLADVYLTAGERRHRIVAGGLGAGLIARFVYGQVDAIQLGARLDVLSWMLLALVVGLHRIAVARSARQSSAAAVSVSR